MSEIRVAINGFGRIGRVCTKAMLQNDNIRIVAINDLANIDTLTHLFKYDSIHGRFPGTVSCDGASMFINNKEVHVYAFESPENLPWNDLNIDVVIESTGVLKSKANAGKHLRAGAKKVVISAPPESDDVKMVVMGINDGIIDGTETMLSNASCTTNCAAPMVKVIDDLCGIESGYITTVHAYTGDQNIHDAPHSKDLRRARAAAESIIPTTTGAARALTRIFPHLHGKIGGAGIRVPVSNGSLTDITCIVTHTRSEEEVLRVFKEASEGKMKGIMSYTEDQIVSRDIIGDPHSCIFDADLVSVIGNMVKVVGWYDNEAGYSHRLVDLVLKIG